jgi:uncharacterized protein YndB with AHSA1/START domain
MMIGSVSAQRAGISTTLRSRFNRPRETVFRAWTDPEVLKRWWCPPGWAPDRMEVDLRVGGAYRLGMQKPGSPVVSVHGCFVEVHVPEKLVYTWNWENAFDHMPPTQVTVEFIENDGMTDVVLCHEKLPEAGVCLEHRRAWTVTWQRLTAALQEIGE